MLKPKKQRKINYCSPSYLGPASRQTPSFNQKERQMKEGERESSKLQKHRRSLQYATKFYYPSKVAKEWRNIPLV